MDKNLRKYKKPIKLDTLKNTNTKEQIKNKITVLIIAKSIIRLIIYWLHLNLMIKSIFDMQNYLFYQPSFEVSILIQKVFSCQINTHFYYLIIMII